MIRPLPFQQAEAKSHSLIQDEFAEPFIFQPMVTRPNWPPTPDATRSRRVIRATFFWDAHDARLGMKETKVISRKPMLSISRCDLPSCKRGDTFTRCATGDGFEVTSAEKDGLTGLSIELVQLGVQD